MKKGLLLLLASFALILVHGQREFDWVETIGSNEFDSGLGVTIDGDDNVITVGAFNSAADFDTGTGTLTLSPVGASDAYVHKMDQYGNTLWALGFGGNLDDEARAVDVDGEGNIYVSGNFMDSMMVDTALLVSAGQTDIFLVKFGANGDFLWAKTYGAEGSDNAQVMDVHPDYGVHLGGDYRTSFDFDPGPDTVMVPNVNGPDAFVLKVDFDGTFDWVRTFGGVSGDFTEGVGVMSDGSVVTVGNFRDTIDFNPGPGVSLQEALGNDVFIVKVSAEGDFTWSRKIGLNSEDLARDMSIDPFDNILITGEFKSTFDLDPSPANNIMQTNGIGDVFYCKYDPDGNLMWGDHMGGTSNDGGYGITAGADGSVHVTGFIFGTLDIIPGPDSLIITTPGSSRDAFVLSLNPDGTHSQTHHLTGTSDEYGFDVHLDSQGDLVAVGRFHGLTDFDPSTQVMNVNNNGAAPDAFMLKLSDCPTVYSSVQDTACVSFSFLGDTLSASGIYEGIALSSEGCDSIVSLDLFILNATDTMLVESDCDTVMVNGQMYSASGNYTQTLTNMLGCDSIIDISVSILSETTVYSDSACFAYELNGSILTQSGQYPDTVMSSMGCDSIVVLDLTILTVDTAIIANDPDLLASATDATYQWIDCLADSIMDGDSLEMFTANYNSEFAVIVTQNGCLDTSACVPITSIGLSELGLAPTFDLYPNPTSGPLTIVPDKNGQVKQVLIHDLWGREVHRIMGQTKRLDIGHLPKGVYLLSLFLDDAVMTQLITRN